MWTVPYWFSIPQTKFSGLPRGVKVEFKECDRLIVNPFTGYMTWAEDTNPLSRPLSLAYVPIFWSQLEPRKGEYAFEQLEERMQFARWREENVRFVLRFISDYPQKDGGMEIPDWLYNELDGDGDAYNVAYGSGFSPNYANPVFLENHERVMKALGKRYDNSEDVAFIEIGSLGHYGEWHIKAEDGLIPFPKKNITDIYVGHYLSAFKNKKLLMRRSYPIAKSKRLGLYNDMIGDERATEEWIDWYTYGYKSVQTGESLPSMPDFWKYAPSGGEISSNTLINNYFGTLYPKVKEQTVASHTSFIGPCSPVNVSKIFGQYANIDDFEKTLGYRFALRSAEYGGSVSCGQPLKVTLVMENVGIAPFYYDWKLEYFIADSKNRILKRQKSQLDITAVLHKVTDRISLDTKGVEEGRYALWVGITNPNTDIPEICFANKESHETTLKIGEFLIKQ